MLLRSPPGKSFNQSICRTKEQKTWLQCLASAVPKFAMPSGAKKRTVSKEEMRKNLAELAKTPRLNRFFFQQNFQAATLNQCGVNRSTFHAQPGWPYWHVIFPVFFCISGFGLCSCECCFLPGQCLTCEIFFHSKNQARNQLGILRVAKSFLRGGQIF